MNFSSSQRNVSVIFTGRIFLLTAVVLSPLLLSGCSSWTGSTSSTLAKQIELQQVQQELAAEPVATKQKTAIEFEQLGDRYLHKKDITRAYLYYLKGLSIEPNNTSLLHKQATILIKNNKFPEAEQIYEKLLISDDKDSQAITGLSKALFGQGRYDEAEQGFLSALKIGTETWFAYEYLGLIYSQKQDYVKAISLFKTALSRKPNNVSIINNLAVTYYLNGDFNEAVHLFRGIAASTNNRKIYNNLALAYFQIGQYENALESFKKGTDNTATAYNNMGQEYLSAKKYNEAIESFEKAIELNPKFYISAQENLDLAKRQLLSTTSQKKG